MYKSKESIEALKNAEPPVKIPVHKFKLLVKVIFMFLLVIRSPEAFFMLHKLATKKIDNDGLLLTTDYLEEIKSHITGIHSAKNLKVSWSEVKKFSLGKNGMIFVHFIESKTNKVSNFVSGYDAVFDNIYQIKTKALVGVLNTWCEKMK